MDTPWGCRFNPQPWSGSIWEAPNPCVSLSLIPLPPSLPLALKTIQWEKYPWVRILLKGGQGGLGALRDCEAGPLVLSESLARLGAAFFVRALPGPVTGVWVPYGVRSGSLAVIGACPIWGSPERTQLDKRWRYLCRTGRLRSEPGTMKVSHPYWQQRLFAQTCESECLPGGGAKVPRPIVVGSVCGSTLIDRSNG